MPIEKCTLNGGGSGFRFGSSGKCYAERAKAEEQGRAIKASETKKSFLEKASEFFDENFGGSKKEIEKSQEVVKAVDTEQRKALFVSLEPEVEDLHGDIYSAEEIEKACHNYNTYCSKANLYHQVEIKDAFPVESYINPCEFTLDDGRVITKGTWLMLWSFEQSELGDMLWKSVKSGDINGISIGCKALVEELTEEE